MGKFLETKHSDVDQKILKKPGKNIEQCKREVFVRYPLNSIKRKLQRISKKNGPPMKKLKTVHAKSPSENIGSVKKSPSFEIKDNLTCDDSVEVFMNRTTQEYLLRVPGQNFDIFLIDEKQAYYKNYMFENIIFHIFTEICLEGLDGITLEAFWKRLKRALKNSINLEHAKEQIWQIICGNTKIKFYILTSERPELVIHDRYSSVNQSGVLMDSGPIPQDIYKVSVVEKAADRGSCATYHQRVEIDIVRNMPLEEVEEEYGNRLIAVADQELRTNVLYDETSDPNYKIENTEYCILERIGRSREFGEVTQGSNSITVSFNQDARSMFHYVKHLSKNNMTRKQLFVLKCQMSEQNKTGRLLHLPRFYHFRKSKYMVMVEEIVDVLRKMPQFRADSKEIRERFPKYLMDKLAKTQEFRRYIDMERVVPYREMFPDSTRKEYLCKSSAKERCIKLAVLKDPHANVCWHDADKDSSDDEEESVPLGTRSFNFDPIRDVYQYILSRGKGGCSQGEIISNFDYDSPCVRVMLRKLKKLDVVIEMKEDNGKQRRNIYITKYAKFKPTRFEDVNENIAVPEQFKQKQREIIASTSRETYTMDRYLLDKANVDPEHNVPSLTYELRNEISCYFLVESSIFVDEIHIGLNSVQPKMNKVTFSLDISRMPVTDQRFDINKSLCEIERYEVPSLEFNNITGEIYGCKQEYDLFIKLLIFKAFFGEIVLNSDSVLNILDKNSKQSRKRNRAASPPLIPDVLINDPKRRAKDKLNYMGDQPVVILKEEKEEDKLHLQIVMSTMPEKYVDSAVYKGDKTQLSNRLLARCNMILEVVYSEPRVFEDFNKLQRHIIEKEAEVGHDRKIDRKSLFRLLQKLTSEGYIKIYKMILSTQRMSKTHAFICHPSVSHDHIVIQNSLEQLKWKYLVGVSKERITKSTVRKPAVITRSPFDARDIMQSISEMKELTAIDALQNTRDKCVGKAYGYRPKFIRTRIMHEILFYLVYGQGDKMNQLTEDGVRSLFASYAIILSEEDLKTMPPIYCKEISWKMFIPPMPKHAGWRDGWALVCDVILRLPISVLVKLHSVNFAMKELDEVLEHPVKRYYLMKNQSQVIRAVVLHKRKYLFDIHELLCRLAHCGLLQFGPEKYKEKDQTFVYLNRQASLLDTTISDPGYNMISQTEYKQIPFYFSTEEDIHSYWYNVYNISMSTKLNQRNIMTGKTITLVDVSAKPDLVRALSAKTQEEAIECDDGELLGDKRGACGLDSSLWVHIVRNWFWAHRAPNPPTSASVVGLMQDCYQQTQCNDPLSFDMLKKSVQPTHNKVYIVKRAKVPAIYADTVRARVPPLRPSKRYQKINRKVVARQPVKMREYYDSVDKAIIKRIGFNTKVHWSEEENRALHLMRAASMFLSARTFKKQNVIYTVLRDVLHRMLPGESKNKTSRSIQRRICQVYVKSKETIRLENNIMCLFKDNRIFKYFGPYIKELSTVVEGSRENENKLTVAFIILMSYFRSHQSEIEKLLSGNRITVDHFSPENLPYTEKNMKELEEEEVVKKVKPLNVKNMAGIRKAVLRSVIHSSLSSKSDHSGIAYQLFKIYQRFSDNTIRDTVTEMKEQQLISAKKGTTKGYRDRGKLHMPFQLSNCYVYSQVTTFSTKTALEAYETFQSIQKRTPEERQIVFKPEQLDAKRYGQMLAVNEVSSFWDANVTYKFHLPDHAVILNPQIKDHSEAIDELARRYLLRLQKDMKNGSEEEHDTENNVEEENEEPQQPLDLSVASTAISDKTIDSLKTWVTSCMDGGRERSPSPEFLVPKPPARKSRDKKGDSKPKRPDDKTIPAIPTIDEIKEAMMDQDIPNEERVIPYITDLTDLLSENSEYKLDDTNIDHLKNHFTTQFPYLEDVELSRLEEFNQTCAVENINAKLDIQEVWDSVRKQIMPLDHPKPIEDIEETIRSFDGSEKDVEIAKALIEFVESKKTFGVSGPEIKEEFMPLEDRCSLESIISLLVDSNILLRTGVSNIIFVHYNYQSVWLVDTFSLSSDEEKQFKNRSNLRQVKEGIDNRLEHSMFKTKLFPWTKVDGTLNEEVFKVWLSNVMSHCLENPGITVTALCDKFYHIIPVDIYSLLEVLKQLGCIELYATDSYGAGIFSEWQLPTVYEASCLDDFSNTYIECNQFSMTCLGSFLSQEVDCMENNETPCIVYVKGEPT